MAEGSLTQVEFREIPGHKNYFAGSDGSIWTTVMRGPGGRNRVGAMRKLGLHPVGRGYLKVTIDHICYRVHRLILLAFVGPCPDGYEACHRNGIANDNRIENLRWGLHAENERDKVRHAKHAFGVRHAMAKITDDVVREIREAYRNGSKDQYQIASQFGLAQATVWGIVHRKIWKHVA